MQLLFTVTAPTGPTAPQARGGGHGHRRPAAQSPHVAEVISPWTAPPAAAADLVSQDGKTGLIVAGITGGESDAQKYAKAN